MLTLRACELVCRGETREEQVRHRPDSETRICPNRPHSSQDDCLAAAQALSEQAKTLSKRTKHGVPREFTRVAADLDASCGEEDFRKAWISIEWMNGCLNNFTKDAELGFCSRNEGYSCALSPRSDACQQIR